MDENLNEIENGEILDGFYTEGTIEYEAVSKLQEFTKFAPKNGTEVAYMKAISHAYERFLEMESLYEDGKDSSGEAEFIIGIINKFMFENTSEE